MKIAGRNMAIGLAISLFSFLAILAFFYLGYLDGLESKSLDLRFLARGSRPGDRKIIIVAVDEDSVNERNLGRWPWARDVHARLISRLSAAGAKVIAFDILFSEPDKVSPRGDAELAREIKKAGSVVLSAFGFLDGKSADTLFKSVTFPIPLFMKPPNSVFTGFTNAYPELDGVCRKVSILVEAADPEVISNYWNMTGGGDNGSILYDPERKSLILFPLSVVSASKYLGSAPDGIIEGIETDEFGEMVLNFAGGYQNYLYVPYHQVLSGKIAIPQDKAGLIEDRFKEYKVVSKGEEFIQLTPEQLFRDKIVLVGATAAGLYDKHPIPFSPAFPGVEIHANAIENILNGNYIKPPYRQTAVVFMLVFAVILGAVLPIMSPLGATGVMLILLVLWTGSCQYVFAAHSKWIHFIPPFFTILLSYVGILVFKLMTEEKEKRKIKSTFSHYLSPKIMDEILSDPSKLKLGGRKEMITVLFSDIRGFTTMSESMSPEEVVKILNEYLNRMTQIVFEYQGTLDKFIGDAVMAFWNAPLLQKDHASLAVNCAIRMMEALAELRAGWTERGEKHLIDIGIGVNTGPMIVGNIGSSMKLDYTLIGDNVNLGSRLEGLNKQYKSHIIVSESTFEFVKDEVEYRELGVAMVKGKEKGVKIYAIYGRKGRPFEPLPPEEKKT